MRGPTLVERIRARQAGVTAADFIAAVKDGSAVWIHCPSLTSDDLTPGEVRQWERAKSWARPSDPDAVPNPAGWVGPCRG